MEPDLSQATVNGKLAGVSLSNPSGGVGGGVRVCPYRQEHPIASSRCVSAAFSTSITFKLTCSHVKPRFGRTNAMIWFDCGLIPTFCMTSGTNRTTHSKGNSHSLYFAQASSRPANHQTTVSRRRPCRTCV